MSLKFEGVIYLEFFNDYFILTLLRIIRNIKSPDKVIHLYFTGQNIVTNKTPRLLIPDVVLL